MEILSSKCCGVNEIHRLSQYASNAEAAMLAFCENQLENNNKFGKEVSSVKNAICTHYFFTGAVYSTDLTKSGEVSASHYGKAFANYITQHRLGVVMESPCEVNRAWHPDHSTIVWMWTPNYERLRDWYVERAGARMVARLKDSLQEATDRVSVYEQTLKNVSKSHYLYDSYTENLKRAQKTLADVKKALAAVQKKAEAA